MVASLCADVSSHVVQVAGVCSLKMGLRQSSATWCGWATPSTMCRAPGTTVPFIVGQANATMICCSCSEGELLPHSPSDSHATTLTLGVLLYVISTLHGSYEAALYISKVMVKMTLQSMPQVTTSHQSVIVNLSVLFHKLPVRKVDAHSQAVTTHSKSPGHYLLSAIFPRVFSRIFSCSSWVVLRKSAFSISMCAFTNWSFKFCI